MCNNLDFMRVLHALMELRNKPRHAIFCNNNLLSSKGMRIISFFLVRKSQFDIYILLPSYQYRGRLLEVNLPSPSPSNLCKKSVTKTSIPASIIPSPLHLYFNLIFLVLPPLNKISPYAPVNQNPSRTNTRYATAVRINNDTKSALSFLYAVTQLLTLYQTQNLLPPISKAYPN